MLRNKKYVVLGISLIAIIIIVTTLTYFVANMVVSDAAVKLGFDYSGSINTGLTGVSFAGEFNFTNNADIPLTLDYVNITVFVIDDGNNLPYEGGLFWLGSTPPGGDYYEIGSAATENELVPANGQVGIPASFDVTSDDALNVIHSGNYMVGWGFHEYTVSGTYLFWHITPQIGFI